MRYSSFSPRKADSSAESFRSNAAPASANADSACLRQSKSRSQFSRLAARRSAEGLPGIAPVRGRRVHRRHGMSDGEDFPVARFDVERDRPGAFQRIPVPSHDVRGGPVGHVHPLGHERGSVPSRDYARQEPGVGPRRQGKAASGEKNADPVGSPAGRSTRVRAAGLRARCGVDCRIARERGGSGRHGAFEEECVFPVFEYRDPAPSRSAPGLYGGGEGPCRGRVEGAVGVIEALRPGTAPRRPDQIEVGRKSFESRTVEIFGVVVGEKGKPGSGARDGQCLRHGRGGLQRLGGRTQSHRPALGTGTPASPGEVLGPDMKDAHLGMVQREADKVMRDRLERGGARGAEVSVRPALSFGHAEELRFAAEEPPRKQPGQSVTAQLDVQAEASGQGGDAFPPSLVERRGNGAHGESIVGGVEKDRSIAVPGGPEHVVFPSAPCRRRAPGSWSSPGDRPGRRPRRRAARFEGRRAIVPPPSPDTASGLPAFPESHRRSAGAREGRPRAARSAPAKIATRSPRAASATCRPLRNPGR